MVATVNNLVESGQLAESREERNRPTLSFVRTVRFFLLLVATVIVATGCGGTRVETSRIDCLDANDVTITANDRGGRLKCRSTSSTAPSTIFCLGERRVVSGAVHHRNRGVVEHCVGGSVGCERASSRFTGLPN